MFDINLKIQFLKDNLPKNIQSKPFYPDAYFYSQYYADHQKGLHFMANVIFSLLKIDPRGCVIDFFNQKDIQAQTLSGKDAAGFYTKINDGDVEREVILINSKYKANPLQVGAILAHEMMHLYLYRLNLKIEDVKENELLTDLATIQTGFAILILNGMSYGTRWWLSLIFLFLGRIYWHSEQLAFGYFDPKTYGRHAVDFFIEQNIKVSGIIGYLTPRSRHFIPHSLFTKKEKTTDYIKLLDRKYIKSSVLKGMIAAVIIIPIIYFSYEQDSHDNQLKNQIVSCKSGIDYLESTINNDRARLSGMKDSLDNYDRNNDIENYNDLVDPYNSLLDKIKNETDLYNNKVKICNDSIDMYNSK